MSWFSDNITDPLSSLFGMNSGDGVDISNGSSSGTGVIDSSDNQQKGGGFWSSELGPALIRAGTGLAGIYFQQQGAQSLAAEQAKERMAELKASEAGGIAKAKIAAGAMVHAAKLNSLANLYSNYANVAERGGEAEGQSALATGRNAGDPISVRLRNL